FQVDEAGGAQIDLRIPEQLREDQELLDSLLLQSRHPLGILGDDRFRVKLKTVTEWVEYLIADDVFNNVDADRAGEALRRDRRHPRIELLLHDDVDRNALVLVKPAVSIEIQAELPFCQQGVGWAGGGEQRGAGYQCHRQEDAVEGLHVAALRRGV